MDGFTSGLAVACIAIALMFVFVASTLARLERRLLEEIDERRELRDEFRTHFWDAHAAFRALGLTKTQKKDSEWVKADPQ